MSTLEQLLADNFAAGRPVKQIAEDVRGLIIKEVKGISLDDDVISHEIDRKWFRFGAYDFGAKVCEKVNCL